MTFESHDAGTNTFSLDFLKEEQVAPFMMLGNQKRLFLVVLRAEVMCR